MENNDVLASTQPVTTTDTGTMDEEQSTVREDNNALGDGCSAAVKDVSLVEAGAADSVDESLGAVGGTPEANALPFDLEAKIAEQRAIARRLDEEQKAFMKQMVEAEAEVYRMVEQMYGAVDNRTNELLASAAALRSEHEERTRRTRHEMESNIASMLSYQQTAEQLVNHGTPEEIIRYAPVLHQISNKLTSVSLDGAEQISADLENDERMRALQAFANLDVDQLARNAGGNLVGNVVTTEVVSVSDSTQTYLSTARFISTLPGAGVVRGVAFLGVKLYVLRDRATVVDEFDVSSETFQMIRSISVEQMSEPLSIVASETSNCLYISDAQVSGVFRMTSDGSVTLIPLPGLPHQLSVRSTTGELVFTLPSENAVYILGLDNISITQQHISSDTILHPLLAVATGNDTDNYFLVCDAPNADSISAKWYLCGVSSSLTADAALPTGISTHLRTLGGVDHIVSDPFGTYIGCSESRSCVELFDASFTFVRRILAPSSDGLVSPTSFALNPRNGRLAVGQWDGSVRLFQVLPTRSHIQLNFLKWT